MGFLLFSCFRFCSYPQSGSHFALVIPHKPNFPSRFILQRTHHIAGVGDVIEWLFHGLSSGE